MNLRFRVMHCILGIAYGRCIYRHCVPFVYKSLCNLRRNIFHATQVRWVIGYYLYDFRCGKGYFRHEANTSLVKATRVSQVNFSLTLASPESPIRVANSLSATIFAIASAKVLLSFAHTMNPSMPSLMTSGIPPIFVPTTGV